MGLRALDAYARPPDDRRQPQVGIKFYRGLCFPCPCEQFTRMRYLHIVVLFCYCTSRRSCQNARNVLISNDISSYRVSCACLSGSLKRPTSQILAAINLNMFPVFMAANLATGAINISMRTLDADTPTAIVILAIHVVFVAGFAVILANLGLTIKV